MQITRLGVETARALAADEIVLREGSEVVVRVLQAQASGGRGLISLAGRRIPAQLPAGVHEGQRLHVVVEARGPDTVLLRILGGDRGGQEQSLGRLAAALAVSGDPELLRVALALTGGAVPLPGGEAGAVEVDPDETGETGSQAGAARARVTLHSPELGPIEIALTLTSATIAAAVTVEPGRPAKVAQAALDDLREALERSTDRQAGATVSARQPQERRPAPPLPVDWVDVRA